MAGPDVLLTGSTGFIGKHFLKQLIDQGRRIRCIARSTSNIESLPSKGFELVRADLADVDSLTKAVEGCKTVFHLAGKARNSTKGDLLDTNRDGTRNLTIACSRQENPPTLVAFSSLAASGPSELDQPVEESDPCNPISKYGESKLEGEKVAADFAYQVPISIIRPPIVFGEEDTVSHSLFASIKKFKLHLAAGLEEKQYSIIHADDLARAAFAVEKFGKRMTPEATDQGVYFATYDEILSGSEFATRIGDAVGRRPIVTPMPHWIVRATAAINELVSAVSPIKPFLNWDKAREATAGSWTCSGSKLLNDTKVSFESIESRLFQTVEGYRQKGWL